ncbi:hypothetical protein KAR91_35875 [Candidatus Pacearchaeota archaeon]|nr:hypothetical protein [Candidatus Pacearchaeota archaeon]
MKKKLCNICNEKKLLSDFGRHPKARDGHINRCKECQCKVDKKYRQTEKGKIATLRHNLKHEYGMTVEQYNQMFADQNGVCFLCGKPELDRRLSVDHNHETGKIRSLLCRRCNMCVGIFENDIDLVKQILKYIKM